MSSFRQLKRTAAMRGVARVLSLKPARDGPGRMRSAMASPQKPSSMCWKMPRITPHSKWP